MAKIPVGATIAQAWRFAFGDFLKIAGVIWFAILLTWLPSLFLRQKVLALMAAHDPSAMAQIWPIMLPLQIVSIILMTMIMIGVARLALGLHTGPAWFYFSLGKPLWRLIGSYLLLLVAFIVGYIAFLLGAGVLGALLVLLTKAVQNPVVTYGVGLLGVAGFLAVFCGYIYSVVRLMFLLIAIIATETPGFALGHAWALGKGNFWRMFGVAMGTLLPFILLEAVFIFYLFRGLSVFDPQQSAAFQAAMDARVATLIETSFHYWYIAWPLGFAGLVLFYGALIGGQCFAWRALTEEQNLPPVPGD